eukprot:scaffold12959_cov53-Attheya_sp.AAC.4
MPRRSANDQTGTASAIIAEAILLSPSRDTKLPSEDERDEIARMSESLRSIVNQSMQNLFVGLESDSNNNEEEESLQERDDNNMTNLEKKSLPISMMKRSTDENELKQKRSTDEDVSESEQTSMTEVSNSAFSDDSAEILQMKQSSELSEALEKTKKLEHEMEEMKLKHDSLVKCLRFDIADLVEEKLNLEMKLLDQTCMNDIQRKDLEELANNSGLEESLEENIKECQEELIHLLSNEASLQSVMSDANRLKQVSGNSHQDVDKSSVVYLLFAITKTLNEYNEKGKGSKNEMHNNSHNKDREIAYRPDHGKGTKPLNKYNEKDKGPKNKKHNHNKDREIAHRSDHEKGKKLVTRRTPAA